jgi:hypothetical protein
VTNRLSARILISCAALALCFAASPARAQFNAFKDPAPSSSGGAVSGPDLKSVSEKVEAGKLTVGASTTVVLTFKNNGSSPVKVTHAELYPPSNVSAEVGSNKCSEAPLPPEAQCAITISVTGRQVGPFRVEVLVDHDGRSRLAEASFSGSVDPAATQSQEQVRDDVEAVPPNLDLESAGGVPVIRSVLLRNRTSDKITLGDFRLDAPPQAGLSYKTDCPKDILPGESCVATVTWTPAVKGISQGLLTVMHSGKSAVTKVDIKGNYTPAASASAPRYPEAVPDMGVLVSDRDQIDFGTGIKSISAITASLVNMGAADVTLKSLTLAGADNGLSLARSGCRAGTVLKPNEACPLTVNWVPSRSGAVVDNIQILHTGVRGVLILEIHGTADAAASREGLALRQPSPDMQGESVARDKGKGKDKDKDGDKDSMEAAIRDLPPPLVPVLDGYVVTSHSPSKAVINGPVGGFVVHDGEDTVIAGTRWTVTIVSTGVILSSDSDEIMLVFDRSLRPASPNTTASSSSSSSSSTPSPAPATPSAATSTATTTPQTGG